MAEREEIRGIKREVSDKRKDAQTQHKADMLAMKTAYNDELTKAVKSLETARQNTEREGRDLSGGQVEVQKTARGFGFDRQGFAKQGMGFGVGCDQERDDDEREIKPPGRDFTP